MSEHGYPIVVTSISDEDGGGFLAFVPDLQGCMADAETQEGAVLSVLSAIGEWLDEAKRLGRDIPEPESAAEKVQHDHEAVRRERRELYAALKSQAKVIKKQEKLLADARAEVERVQAATESLMETECSTDELGLGGLWVVQSTLASVHVVGKRKQRLLS